MQPVKISILGDFVDCQIYRGRFYLWTFDGELKIYRWNEIIESLPNSDRDTLPLKFCFLDGNYLYKTDLVQLFSDEDFRKILIDKFTVISQQEYQLTESQVDNYLLGQQDTPGNILPTDTEIYSSNLYFINEHGLFSSKAHRPSKKYPVSTKPKKLWDCNLLALKANSYPQLALSAGSEGLFECDLSIDGQRNWGRKDPLQISSKHSSFANYTFWSIYNSSLVSDSYMALFDLHESKNYTSDFRQRRYIREFKEEINEGKIFSSKEKGKHLSWGVDDKIYRATENGFEIVKFRNKPNFENDEHFFTRIRKIKLQPWKGKVIGGSTSYYGTIVECENALVIVQSDGEIVTIPGPISRWRIYPRSMNYQNHLHVIKDDRIEIYSFNQDYFLKQDDKLIGLEFKFRTQLRGRFSSRK